jgi:hypothetical protein
VQTPNARRSDRRWRWPLSKNLEVVAAVTFSSCEASSSFESAAGFFETPAHILPTFIAYRAGDLACSKLDDMERELTLRIVLGRPPKGVDFGLQKGRGHDYETVQTQRSEGKDLEFQFNVGVKAATGKAMPALTGPFVQGPAGERFVYIDIGTYAGQVDSGWARRLKIPLAGITMDMIVAEHILETRVPGTGRDGGPSCATVKPFDGWKPMPAP